MPQIDPTQQYWTICQPCSRMILAGSRRIAVDAGSGIRIIGSRGRGNRGQDDIADPQLLSRRHDPVTITVLRNIQRRRTLFWPVNGLVMPVAPGDVFAVVDSELDAPGLRDALAALIEIGWIEIAEGLEPLRH